MGHFIGALVSLLLLVVPPSSCSPPGSCSQEQMMSILGTGEAPCRPRKTIVPVEVDEVGLQVVAPSHVEVMRCSGSCPLAHFSCLPEKASIKQVEVSVVLSPASLVKGPTAAVCDTLQVEVHTSCQCGCPISPADCPGQGSHYFLPYECRCACRQEEGRGSCLARGWYWDPASCDCMCPGRPYPGCPSGYVYDYQSSCSCVPIHVMGFTEIEVVLVIFGGSCLVSLISMVQCYRQGVGIFRTRRVGLARDRQFRQALDSLNSKFDQSIRMKKVESGDSLEDKDLLRPVRGTSL